MAEQVTNDVVKEAQSMGRPAPIDDTASTTKIPAVNGELPSGPATSKTNPLEAPHPATTADSADAAPPDSARASDKAHGEATQQQQQQTDASAHESKQPFLNGDSGDHEHSASESQAVADASGSSDTDISRPGSVDQSKRHAGHVRTNSSVKKPSTFKSVSVTKTFLAKSAVSTPVARPGEKTAPAVQPSPSALLTAKPRLVAKLGTGNAPRALGKVNGAGSGPDASKVWNKNQPVPTPPPKQFTDEELKQQYGIHLATRLQADEAGKEAKWADIDDDEDDWAPEAVQWMDGTKSSVAAVENQLLPAEEPKTILKPETPVENPNTAPVTATNTPKPSVTGGAKTILKPGAHSQPTTGKSSLVLKGQPEKPTLVAKPSATEKKSPWASLPPVEKLPPVQINPPLHQPPPQRFSQRDSYGYDSMPAKEIAPDDFNRSWRDDRGTRPELYNSHSGRYEPVNDMRRGSVRDPGFRQQPSVLQRPSQDGPAEPSAAFQTFRSSADMPTWGRRRNSSNVSGEQVRRMSIDRRAPDMPRGPMNIERRESHSVNGIELSDPGAPRQPPFTQAVSPNLAHVHPVSPYGSVTSSGTHDLPTPNAAPAENPVEVQKRLMADKIERARLKKQQEQEAEKKAEAERKERIAKRLAAMGPPPEPKSKTKEQSPSRATQQSPQKDKAVPVSAQSPPKPPVPTADGEVAQYGMMKVHHAQPVKKPSLIEHTTAVKGTEPASSPSAVKAQTENQARAPPALNQHSTQSFDTFTRDSEKSRQPVEQSKNLAHQSEGAISAGPKPQVPQAAWSPATAPQPRPWTSQVWGPPPTKERALGNGTFDSGYNRGQPRPGPQQHPVQSTTSVAPIALGLAAQPSATSQSTSQLPSSQPMYPQSGSLPVQAVVAPSRPGPIAPPLAKGWSNFQDDIRKDDANMVVKARQDRERLGEAFRPEIRETYKDQRGQAQTTLHDKVAGNAALSESSIKKDDAAKHAHEGPSPQQSLTQSTPLQQATGPRASRFFPRPTETATQATTTTSSKADSPPPPPETETHPAFTGDISHPLVRLPKPSPVVRLPPLATGSDAHTEATGSMSSRGQSLGARPLAMNPEWQARFNKLLEKPGSAAPTSVPGPTIRNASSATLSVAPSKPGALAPAALSKASLDVRGAAGPATVSLPSAPQTRTFADDRGREVITRKGTEALFEDREFGSLPTVRLSKAPHLAANDPAVNPPKDDPFPRFKRFENPFTIRRLEVFDIERLAQKIDIVIHIPNMRNAITMSMPRKRRGPKTNSQFKPKQNITSNGYPTGGPKDRPRKPSQQGQGEHSNNSPRPSAPNAWGSSNRSTPSQPPTTWARRAAAPVH
ncbi:uncharacterized protein K460DRAFT_283499 [Cucurbitaria berberidis CBS 394.84]|uniref:PI-PLC Y-box domain-containing protein n=1 Tax=Cucurbitaria berberidis CBS 394.84 TaxID=1168544 RepID=A0A9P4GJW8_9PLEO|nr:uncharacterized protein K460DRAFT_283499 [Cucurbitaria berberidis CBS 394.84]KAF1846794.1 hypothetical protein K460DRAFT_283499 [Cucurbitaria berberidis CBS 394.84]